MASENYRAPSVTQSAELAEQQGVELPPLPEAHDMGYYIDSTMRKGTMTGYTRDQMRDYARAALAATGKQQAGEAGSATFDDGGDYYADQHGDGAWATYLRNGKGWVYNFGHGNDAEIRAKSVARELNRQVAAISARMQVGEVQGDAAELLAEMRDVEDYFKDVDPNPIHLATVQAAIEALAARQPAPSNQSSGISGEVPARQPGAQVPFGWWLEDANGVGYFSRKIQPAALHAYRASPGYSATPLHAAPPAQGIDLGQFRPAVELFLTYAESEVAAHERFWGHAPDPSHKDAKKLAEAHRLLALIDQRDAAPGVGQ